MKILMLLEREFPPDERVEKEISSLTENGHEVHIACFTRKGGKEFEQANQYYIFRKQISKFIYKSSAACLIVPFYFWFWKKFIRQLFKRTIYDAIHIHDLPLTRPGIYFKKKYNCKLICDQHEYYSNWIVHTAHYNTFFGKVIKLLSNWKSYEKKFLKRADLIITVEEPLRDCYITDINIDPDRIIILPNTPLKQIFNPENIKVELLERYNDSFVLFYAGGLDILRGLEIPIKALSLLVKDIPNIKLVMAGQLMKYFNPYPLVEELNVKEFFEFVGWQGKESLPSYIAASDICFFTPPSNRDEINRTIATKIYQYIIMGKPVIVSQAEYMKKFVEKHKVGLVLKNNNPEDFAEKVLMLYKDKTLYDDLSKNCFMTSEVFHWDITSKSFISRYHSLENKLQ